MGAGGRALTRTWADDGANISHWLRCLCAGATPLGAALKQNQSLKVLLLASNKIGSDAVTAIAGGLRTNTRLHTLNLA